MHRRERSQSAADPQRSYRPAHGTDPPYLYEVVSGVAGAERPLEEQVVPVRFLLGLQQLVVLLAVQRHAALAVAPCILKEKAQTVTDRSTSSDMDLIDTEVWRVWSAWLCTAEDGETNISRRRSPVCGISCSVNRTEGGSAAARSRCSCCVSHIHFGPE